MAKGQGQGRRQGRGRSSGESSGRGAARRGARSSASSSSSTGRPSSASQTRPHRQAGVPTTKSTAGRSASARSGSGSPRASQSRSTSSPQGVNAASQSKGRAGRTPGPKQTGRPLHSGRSGRQAAGGRSDEPAQGRNRPGANKGRTGKGQHGTQQRSQTPSAARSRQAAPGTARSTRTSSTQAGRSNRRRTGWGKGAQWARIGGGRLTGSPDSAPAGPKQPRSGRLRKPIPPRPRYGLRRMIALGVLILLILAFLGALIGGYLWARGTIRSQDQERAAAQVHTVYPTPVDCDPSALSGTVNGPESVGVGAGATFSISLVNNGSTPCLVDAGSQSVGVRVSSGSQQVWDSTTCPLGQAQRSLLLPPGQATDISVTWNGNIATSDCSAATAPPAAQAGASATPTPADGASPQASDQAAASEDPSATDASSASASASQGQTTPEGAAGAGTYRFRFVMGDKDLTEDRVFVIG